LLFGLTASTYGVALLIDHRFPRWLGVLAIAGGAPTAIAGVVIAYTGFSPPGNGNEHVFGAVDLVDGYLGNLRLEAIDVLGGFSDENDR